jgi:hypothetical protein
MTLTTKIFCSQQYIHFTNEYVPILNNSLFKLYRFILYILLLQLRQHHHHQDRNKIYFAVCSEVIKFFKQLNTLGTKIVTF